MKKVSEGRKMWFSVMAIFLTNVVVFILFDDYERKVIAPLNDTNDLHLFIFSIIVMCLLGFILYRYAKRMDERISREQLAKESAMRRELTQNISHELKTPVASILGYTDTILQNPDMSEEQQKKFIERTNIQAQRLTALLQDISTLNKMDYAADRLTQERVNISELVSDIVEETQLALERQQMTLHNCLPEDICVNGNTAMLYSIFRNLTDNAVNYAGTGTVIEISAQSNGKYWDFTFSDNGNGVPPEHLPRLFERFYRLDKGRSRSMGGTGLGLAIVKNAVLLHGGSITVENAPQGGLCFHFSIKR